MAIIAVENFLELAEPKDSDPVSNAGLPERHQTSETVYEDQPDITPAIPVSGISSLRWPFPPDSILLG
jgi:hypothetical protein